MSATNNTYKRLSLFTGTGERKYLNEAERDRFLKAIPVLKNPIEQTYCEMLFWTGCRVSEALALTHQHIDLEERMIIIRSLKKRSKQKGSHYRPVPIPDHFADRLNQVHSVGLHHMTGSVDKLWGFSRTTAWQRISKVMHAAQIHGAMGCGKGLRHSYGVHAALKGIPETRIKKWLGHEHLETTSIYLDVAGPEDRAIAERMWT